MSLQDKFLQLTFFTFFPLVPWMTLSALSWFDLLMGNIDAGGLSWVKI